MRRSARPSLRFLVITLMSLVSIVPFYVLLLIALNSPSRRLSEGVFFLPEFYFRNFADAWRLSSM
ncbi:MAG: hypothetical protein AB1700_12620, partial [Bacillota bacterium]